MARKNKRDPAGANVVNLEIHCPVKTRALSILRSFATCMASEVGFDDDATSQIEMAVDEACANVMRHAYKHLGISSDLPPEKLEGELEKLEGCVLRLQAILGIDYLTISIIDHGIGLNRMPAGVKDMQEYQDRGGSGGLGIYIIKNFMDEVQVDSPGGTGTILTMTKYLQASTAKASR